METVYLRNVASGSVVSVPAEKAARLGHGWELIIHDAAKPLPAKVAPRKRAAAKAKPAESTAAVKE